MANRYFGLNYGQHEQDIAEGAASVGKDIEIKVNVTTTNTRQDAFKLTEMIARYIISGKTQYPPS